MKNSAFLFIKPHAVTEPTKALVTKGLEDKGFTILTSGELTGKQIDEKMLIDTHYYAIASKATLLKPSELNVPAEKFQAKFGLGWQEALDKGVVFNAKDACEQLGLDAAGLDAEWAKAKKAGRLIKFGGGFYCGLIDSVPDKDPIYAFNGFFMSMRSKYVEESAKLFYFVVEWDAKTMSWEDFRANALGPTDPADAPEDSLRGQVMKNWESLELKSQPNVGDNGVHGSASPFEALAERMNWLGVAVADDPFGAAMLEAGISEETIKAWSVDPQVTYGAPSAPIKRSLFDSLEDMSSAECLARCKMIATTSAALKGKDEEKAPAPLLNSAFMFIKPHAVTEATKALVKKGLADKGLTITAEGELTAEVIDKKMLIDNHYYAIASKATILTPDKLNVPADKFKGKFGLEWKDALDKGVVFNAKDACTHLGLDSEQLDAEWAKAKKAGKLIKFGGGFYCGMIDTVEGKDPIYAFNGFFMSMRGKYVAPGAKIYYYVVEWDAKTLSWEDFRGQVLGPTDPADAPEGSLRGQVMKNWESLELKSQPNVGDNGVHGSASPFEAFAERCNWLEAKAEDDAFGKALLAAGISAERIKELSVDPQVTYGAKAAPIKGSFFDSVEDIDSDECLARCIMINNGTNNGGKNSRTAERRSCSPGGCEGSSCVLC